MNEVGWDVIVVLVILLVGGFFSGAEMALVSLREGQVRSLAQQGKRGQRAAKLAQDPNRFLSAVQIGVTKRSWTIASRIWPPLAPRPDGMLMSIA